MTLQEEFVHRANLALFTISRCPERCESHRDMELNLTYVKLIATCTTPAGWGTVGAQLVKVPRTES